MSSFFKPVAMFSPLGGPSFIPQTFSLDFNGTDENMYNATGQNYGIEDSWSIGFWWKPDGSINNSERIILGFDRTGAAANYAITISARGDIANNPMQVELYDGSGDLQKDWRWDNSTEISVWAFHMITWDGTNLELYWNGINVEPTNKDTDNPITMADNSSRELYIGRSEEAVYYEGIIHAVGFWNTRLLSAEVIELFNAGIGSAMDWRNNGPAYQGGDNLVHWWRLGYNELDIGEDTIGEINMGDDASNMTYVDDAVEDAPDAYIFVPDKSSLDFDGNTEKLANWQENDFGHADIWTISFWVKPEAQCFTQDETRIFGGRRWTGGSASNENGVFFDILGGTANDPLRVVLYDSSGTLFKNYTWDSVFTQSQWTMITATWDGSVGVDGELKMYIDGTLTAATAETTDNDGNQGSDSSWGLTLAGSFDIDGPDARIMEGKIHTVAMWDVVLTDGEQTELYNGGDGNQADYVKDGVTYASSANLLHWWRLGQNLFDIDADWGVSQSVISLLTDSVDVNVNDSILDAP